MPKIISIHEYVLKTGSDPKQFEEAIQKARRKGLLQLPGLVEDHFIKGVKGSRQGCYAAIWVYESREAWQKLWGTPGQPLGEQDYPENWKVWEDEVLAPFLSQDPDKIEFTAYEEIGDSAQRSL